MSLTEEAEADVEFIKAPLPSSESNQIRSKGSCDAHASFMASGMAPDDSSFLPCRTLPGPSGDSSSASTHSTSKLGELPGSRRHGREGVSDPSCTLPLPARQDQTLWERSCLSCGKKWKWSDTRDQWLEDVPRQDKLPLPLPCSSNAPGYIDKKHTPALSMGLEPSPLVQTVVKTQALEDTHCSPSKPARGALPKSVRTSKRDTRRRDQEEAMEEDYDWDFVSP